MERLIHQPAAQPDRWTGDILALSPLIIDEAQIDEIFTTVAEVLRETD